MHSGGLCHLTNVIWLYNVQWAEGYSGFWLVKFKYGGADVDLILDTLLTFLWTDGARSSQSGYPDYGKALKDGAAGIAQSVKRLATGWIVRESNPGGSEIFRTRPDRPWGPPSLLYNGYPVFPRGKAAGGWCWPHTPIFSAEVLNRVELYLYPP